jgi:hypothetical protein
MADLPTIEECREFKRVIDRGREDAGLDPIEFLEFDDAAPGDGSACLSAMNLFAEAGYRVGTVCVHPKPGRLATHDLPSVLKGVSTLPASIRAVTDRFDGCYDAENPDEALDVLRARLVEAGVVAPGEDG